MDSPFDKNKCYDCPRRCGVDRSSGEGYCGADDKFRVANLCLHKGEEPVISGKKGSITLFFPGCNLRCLFCQNYQISRRCEVEKTGETSLELLTDRIVDLLEQGGHNLNFVSPSHMACQTLAIIRSVRARGLNPPVVYNSNGYDSVETLQKLEGFVDVYMPDMKYGDPEAARSLSGAGDYVDVAWNALAEMRRQVGARLFLDDDGMARRGMIVRHLVLPGHVQNSLKALDIVEDLLTTRVFLSLMAQYHPDSDAIGHPVMGRTLTHSEYDTVMNYAMDLGFADGWMQDLEDSPRHYRPDFRQAHPFEG